MSSARPKVAPETAPAPPATAFPPLPRTPRTAPATAPLTLLRRLEWRLRGTVESVLGGEYRSSFRGRGMEFDQVVKYTFGDDVRDIDWNVTARLGEPYLKKFVEEREVTVLAVFEDTPSLQFGSGAASKRETLLELAGLLFLLAAVNHDRIGFVHAAPDGCVVAPPVRGRGAIHHAAAKLLSAPPPALANTDRAAIPWHQLTRLAPRGSILVWLGDFPPRPIPQGWTEIQKRFRTLGFRVDDPWENEFPISAKNAAAGDAPVLYDPVSGTLTALESSAAARAAHARWRGERDSAWNRLFPDAATRLVANTNQSVLDTLVRFFARRSSK
ncbi:MAG: DUF58 domain-containing protein [Puniceicoccales bacterium]|jgi:uncharacterized protein (DUF58 family)|nr:DUF58 domain-containing protein [Puniceicoccales bacterium]